MRSAPGSRLADDGARVRALTDHRTTLLVEAGAGSGKTAIMAGRIALMLSRGIHPKEIVAITFTELAASELLGRIETFVRELVSGKVPTPLRVALPGGLGENEARTLANNAGELDQIVCTTIHGFCQHLIKPYPVEAAIDPGAVIADPSAAELAYQDLTRAWLSARFGRGRSEEGLGRLPSMGNIGGEEDFLNALVLRGADRAVRQIEQTALLIKMHRTARAPESTLDSRSIGALVYAMGSFSDWYRGCGVEEESTAALVAEFSRLADQLNRTLGGDISGRRLAELLFHEAPSCRHGKEPRFKQWGRKGKWKKATRKAGRRVSDGETLSNEGERSYQQASEAYRMFVTALGGPALKDFVDEFETLRQLYADYKKQAALLDFDDLLHHARDLLVRNASVRGALAKRHPYILVDEFQDTDPLQAEILWLLCGEGEAGASWTERRLRPGSLFLVGDPKQAIYRFRGADVATYLEAKDALIRREPDALVEITTNFRSRPEIIDFVNARFDTVMNGEGQAGFVALSAFRTAEGKQPRVAACDIPDAPRDDRARVRSDALRIAEATVVADIVQRLIGECEVVDPGTGKPVRCRPGDIALLAPSGTALWIYERALEAHRIPIATQAGKGFYRRQEVQDMIALTRVLADRRDTLALGALLRGPLVGLSEAELLDAVQELNDSTENGQLRPLSLWSVPSNFSHPVLRETLETLQMLARKNRQTTPYLLLAETVETLDVRAILRARYRHGAERALANVELYLEKVRAYDVRGLTALAQDMRERWEDVEKEVEGRPDAEQEAVSLITMHSAKGLEWPVVIPINTVTEPKSDVTFVHRRADDTVHFKLMGQAGTEYERVAEEEKRQLAHERVRLWYVACTRARDLLLLPRFSEISDESWASVIDFRLGELPNFDASGYSGRLPDAKPERSNEQTPGVWHSECNRMTEANRTITWHRPSLHESGAGMRREEAPAVYTDPDECERLATASETVPQGGTVRGLVLHKLMEELITGETEQARVILKARAQMLLTELGVEAAEDPARGPNPDEMAATILRTLNLSEIAELFPRLDAEYPVYGANTAGNDLILMAGIADAVTLAEDGRVETVVDWKSDVSPTTAQIEDYRAQISDYLKASGARRGMLIFMTSGRIVEFQEDR